MIRTDDLPPYLEELLSPKECLLMNFLFQIDRIKNSDMRTDGESWITAQDHPAHPMWIWKRRGELSLSAVEEISEVIREAIEKDPHLEVNGDIALLPAVERAAATLGRKVEKKLDCTGYAMLKTPKLPGKGRLVAATAEDIPLVSEMVRIMYEDSGMEGISDEEALDIARDKVDKGQIRLLLDENGKCVSMARIACTLSDMARINTVVTLRDERCKGWGRILMSHLCREIMRGGRTPVLFAEKDYAPSNRCYRKAGFTPLGDIRVWRFVEE